MNIFGSTDALIGPIQLLVGAVFAIGALVFRKSIANDMMGVGFSIIGSIGTSCILFVATSAIFGGVQIPFVIGLIGWAGGGFGLAEYLGDGESG
jgi:hypothetical protein